MKEKLMRHTVRATYLLAVTLALMLWPQATRFAGAQESDFQYSYVVARKFDEFGAVGGCDHGARLDNFAITLQDNPTLTGYIIIYGPEGQGAGTAHRRQLITEDYLVNSRGIDPSRFKSIYGGRFKEISASATELWLVPEGAEQPVPQEYGNRGATFTGRFIELDISEALYGAEEGTGPAFGDHPYAGFADILRQQPDKRGYIVAYNSHDGAPGAWRRAAKEVATSLESGHGLGADRIKIIYGGYRQLGKRAASARVELWVAAAGAPPPVAEAREPEPRPEKAVQITSVDKYALGYGDNPQLAFERFAEILKNDEQMRVCIIIRLEAETEETEGVEVGEETAEPAVEIEEAVTPTEPVVEETPELDLVQLVEKWKSDLEEKYGISRDRLMVITGTAQEYSAASLETWAVPPGALLPDPNIVEEDEALSDEEITQAQQNPQ